MVQNILLYVYKTEWSGKLKYLLLYLDLNAIEVRCVKLMTFHYWVKSYANYNYNYMGCVPLTH